MKTSVVHIDRSAQSRKTDVYFPEGMIGFGEHKDFCISKEKSKKPFLWLQAEKDPELSFIVIDPKEFKDDYNPSLNNSDRTALGVSSIDECQCFVVVMVPKDSDKISANLLAPIIMNKKEGIARQIILQDENYSVQHLILEEMLRKVEEKDVSSFAQAE